MKVIVSVLAAIYLAGCSIVGQSDVETASYTLLKSDDAQKIEVRNYESIVLVTTKMSRESGNGAFRKLFSYISGDNVGASEISMTAPVFMNETADTSSMSFVMPNDFTLKSTPKPTDPNVWVTEYKNYKVAAIQFSGTLSDSNVEKHTEILANWITENGYITASNPVKAGYNGPFTLPMMRRNEVMIEVK